MLLPIALFSKRPAYRVDLVALLGFHLHTSTSQAFRAACKGERGGKQAPSLNIVKPTFQFCRCGVN